jgi:DNA-binding NtrC family response regulator
MRSQPTLLIVEDDVAVTAALYELLSFSGYRVITARSTQEAEAVVHHLGDAAIHLVISDIHLTRRPDACEGYMLYQHWAALYPALPFILMSAYPSSGDLPDIAAQTVRFLEKPFESEALLRCIQETLGQLTIPTCSEAFDPGRDQTITPSADATATEPLPEPPTAPR